MITLESATDEELLMELIRRNGYSDAAGKVVRHGVWHECVVGIGEDNAAFITLDDEDMAKLRDSML